jgi:hypothetical protein
MLRSQKACLWGDETILQLLDCQRNGPDLPVAERVIAYVIVCHPNNLAHTLGFCPKLWTAQQHSQSGWDFTGPQTCRKAALQAVFCL